MIVADTSAWVEFFRSTGSAVHLRLSQLLDEEQPVAVTEIVIMELLAGARSTAEAADLRAHLLSFPVLKLDDIEAFDAAAALFRSCRDAGETVRELTDCLIAAPTIAAGATLLQVDRDFEILARHTPLRLEPV